MSSHNSLWKFHVDVHLDRSLRIGHNKVNLAKSLSKNNSKYDHEPVGKPCHNRCVCFEVVHSIHLLSAVKVQPGLVRLDLVSCEIALVPHGPYRWYNLGVIRNFITFLEGPVVGIHMSVDFLDYNLHKFPCVWLSECLLKIHDVTHHLGVERDRVSHVLLEIKVSIMEVVFISFSYGGLTCHVVHTLGD